MRCLRRFEELGEVSGSVVTIGNFDGFHLGHQKLAERVVELGQGDLLKMAVTFDPHPREVLFPGQKVPRLSLWTDLVQGFETFGFQVMFRLQFDENLRNTSAADFLKTLRDKTRLQHLVIGHDFKLGAKGEGDGEYIRSWCLKEGVGFHQIPSVSVDGKVVSSQRIRQCLEKGEVVEAKKNLGRSFSLTGEVVHGDARGNQLGFPTANLKIPQHLALPSYGVYAGWAHFGQTKHQAVCNFGIRPTFSKTEPLLEVHIINFSGDIYGQSLKFEFEEFLRAEMKFQTLEELKAQIAKDLQSAQHILTKGVS